MKIHLEELVPAPLEVQRVLVKMRGFNAINLREGYPQLTILSPLEVAS